VEVRGRISYQGAAPSPLWQRLGFNAKEKAQGGKIFVPYIMAMAQALLRTWHGCCITLAQCAKTWTYLAEGELP
jgi:hypothetical protein